MSIALGDQLLDQLLLSDLTSEQRGRLANDLLHEVFNDYSVLKLVRLLHSQRKEDIDTGAWILSELGSQATPLLDEVVILLNNPNPRTRFYALDSILTCTTREDGRIVAEAIKLINDPEKGVRWKTLCFLSYATADQLLAATQYLPQLLAQRTSWLQKVEESMYIEEVIKELSSAESLTRLFAVAGAARLAWKNASVLSPLESAAGLLDDEIHSFAKFQLEQVAIRHGLSGSQ